MVVKSTITAILKKWYVILCLLIVVAALAAYRQTNLTPNDVRAPSVRMPSPNARDYYDAAERIAHEGEAQDMAMRTAPMPIKTKDEARQAADPTSDYHVFTLAEKDRLVAENESALALLRQGMKYRYMGPPADLPGSYNPNYAKDRSIARLVMLEGKVRAEHGEWAGAMDSYLDDIKFGSDLPHGGALAGLYVGVACQSIGRYNANAVIDHLTEAESIADARRLAAIDTSQMPFSQTIQEERWSIQESLIQTLRKRDWRSELEANEAEIKGLTYEPNSVAGFEQRFRWALTSPAEISNACGNYMTAWSARANLPWPAAHSVQPPDDPWGILPQADLGEQLYLYALTINRLLETQLALHAYFLDHRRYPLALTELTPKYQPDGLIDPFSDNQPFEYKPTGSRYLLYGIGPDAVDNGGTPIRASSTGFDRYDVQTAIWEQLAIGWQFGKGSENGDIVAGINR